MRCPRLVAYREMVAREKRRAYRECEYWGKPVPGFGDPEARVLILGLAPGAHGSNRTGRPFTGDASGKFMYPVLYETGFANQPDSDRSKRRTRAKGSVHYSRGALRSSGQQATSRGVGELFVVSGSRVRGTRQAARRSCLGQNCVRRISELLAAQRPPFRPQTIPFPARSQLPHGGRENLAGVVSSIESEHADGSVDASHVGEGF